VQNNEWLLSDRDPGRREQVADLLAIVLEYKLQAGMEPEAERLLEAAWRLCNAAPTLPGPWRPLVAYRLGLMRMRAGDFDAADELLVIAAELHALAPWPALFRLPTLVQLGAPLQVQREAYAEAKRAVGEYRPLPMYERPWFAPRIQGEAFGVLEFATFFMGIPYDGLQGFRAEEPYLSGTRSWLLLGIEEPARLKKELAVDEFIARQRASGDPADLFFALPASGTAWMRVRGKPTQTKHPQVLRLLSHLLMGVHDVPGLRARLGLAAADGESESDAGSAGWDQARSRANVAVRDLLREAGCEHPAPLVRDEAGDIRLAEGIRLVGLVEEAALDAALRIRKANDSFRVGFG
jgi:hypothetical protein